MTETRYIGHDRHAVTAAHLRPKSTWLNPRYWVIDTTTNLPVDEATTKRAAQMAAAHLNREARPSWGQIEVGQRVTSRGRHGTGQPIVNGTVYRIDGQTVQVQTLMGLRTRTISNLRAL